MSTTTPSGHGDVAYVELHVEDPGRARTFWSGLFGWRFVESNLPDYDMIDGVAPMGGLAHGSDAPIGVSFGTDDIDASADRVRALGGTAGEIVTIPSGRLAECSDDQGTRFRLWQDATTEEGDA